MNIIFSSFLISLLAAFCVWLMGRRDPGGKPWLTVICLAVLLLLPALTLLPKWHIDLLGSVNGGGVGSNSTPWWLVAWVGGSVLMLARILVHHRALGYWLSESFPLDSSSWQETLQESASMMGLGHLPELRMKSGIFTPVVTGLRRPVILMPNYADQWSSDTRKMAILHELGHLQRRDLWIRYTADIVCALHWYNPLVWWLRNKLLSQCEYACDTRVIDSGVDVRVYVRALCDVVEKALSQRELAARPCGVCAMADHAPLRVRAARLMREPKSSKPWLAASAAVPTAATALGLTLVRPVVIGKSENREPVQYSQEEIDMRHSANPFPGND